MGRINSAWLKSHQVIWKLSGEYYLLNGLVDEYTYEGFDAENKIIDGSLSDAQFLYYMAELLAFRALDVLVMNGYSERAVNHLKKYFGGLSPIDYYHPNFLRFTTLEVNTFSCVKFKFDKKNKYFVLYKDGDELWIPESLSDQYLIDAEDSDTGELKDADFLSFSTTEMELLFMTEDDIVENVQATTKVIENYITAFNNSGIEVRDFEDLKVICALIL